MALGMIKSLQLWEVFEGENESSLAVRSKEGTSDYKQASGVLLFARVTLEEGIGCFGEERRERRRTEGGRYIPDCRALESQVFLCLSLNWGEPTWTLL